MKVCLFDDSKISQFYPLTLTRPVSFLRIGMYRIIEKVKMLLEMTELPDVHTKAPLREYYDFQIDKSSEYIWINSRVIPHKKNFDKIKALSEHQTLYLDDGFPGAFRGNFKSFTSLLNDHSEQKRNVGELSSFSFIWDLIYANEDALKEDFDLYFKSMNYENSEFGIPESGQFYCVEEENIRVHKSARIEPGVVLDASDGPIVLDANVRIMPNSVIVGPAYIGPGTLIKSLSKIYGHISIGPVCKIGGEVAETIIQGYSNKQHDGFLGHAYIGEWCNLGADTNNSDLKNNYGEITVYLNGKPVNTGKRFLGLIMGDHSKSAINTSFNTGTIVGIHCNIFARNFVKKYIPSFSWVGDDFIRKYQFDKAMEVAKIVMARRNVEFTSRDLQLFEYIYKNQPENHDG